MDDWKAAFGEEWDAVVLGTGMKECLLSGLLSVAGKKVLAFLQAPSKRGFMGLKARTRSESNGDDSAD